jgi:DNA-directed RNA polymerase subunit alpha
MEGYVAERRRFIKIPEVVHVDHETTSEIYAKFTLGPLSRGWGWTMGTVLRRAMLSSVEGAAPTQLRINGVIHEFSTIDGVLEDVPLIVLNVKKLRFRKEGEGPEYAYLRVDKPGEYKGKDLELSPNLKLVNPDTPILTVTVQDKSLHLELKVEHGRGYETQEVIKKRSPGEPTGTIFLDAFYSPVRQVKLDVTNVRYGDRTDYEQVVFEVFTDGSVTPEQALEQTAELLRDHVEALLSLSDPKLASQESDAAGAGSPWANVSIESLEVPQTVKKALTDHGIYNVSDLLKYSEDEIMTWGDIKPRSFASLRSRLQEMGVMLTEGNNEEDEALSPENDDVEDTEEDET